MITLSGGFESAGVVLNTAFSFSLAHTEREWTTGIAQPANPVYFIQ
jgi:hypothetical protein